MPLHDFKCENCELEFEELHDQNTLVMVCPSCNSSAHMLISRLADYTGQNSLTVQYATRNAPKSMQDCHLTKVSSDTSFLRKGIGKQQL